MDEGTAGTTPRRRRTDYHLTRDEVAMVKSYRETLKAERESLELAAAAQVAAN